MKITENIITIFMVICIISCGSSDEEQKELDGKGNISIEFDNSYSKSDLLLETTPYTANGSEKIKISEVKYIISNIRLEDDEGNLFTYPKEESYFIVDEKDTKSQFINLSNLPIGNYKKIIFGVGIDHQKYLQGAEGQGSLLARAQESGMMWVWQAGYRFFVLEGVYTSENTKKEVSFLFHIGSHGSTLDNYKEVTLELKNTARVRVDATPEIHIVADISNVLMGKTKFMLDQVSQIKIDPVKSPQVATNINGMFSVHHIHN